MQPVACNRSQLLRNMTLVRAVQTNTEYASAPALVVIVLPDSKGSVCCELQSFHVSLDIGSGCRPSWGRHQAPS